MHSKFPGFVFWAFGQKLVLAFIFVAFKKSWKVIDLLSLELQELLLQNLLTINWKMSDSVYVKYLKLFCDYSWINVLYDCIYIMY